MGIMERRIVGFRGFTPCLSGAKKAINYGIGNWNKETGDPAMKESYEMGKSV